jgi:NitT/TauT family transport system permease protein
MQSAEMTNSVWADSIRSTRGRSSIARGLRSLLKPTLLVVLLLVLWELAVRLLAVPRFLVPPPSSVFLQIYSSFSVLLHAGLITTRETLEGFALAVVFGVALAILVISSKTLEESLYPVLIFVQLTPKMAVAPLLIVWLGFGEAPKAAIAFLLAFFPIVISTIAGLRSVSPDLLEMLQGMRANRAQILLKARFPSALPFIFSAMRVSITLSVTGAVVAEFVGANEGLGYLITVSTSNMQTDLTFAAIFGLALIGGALFSLIRLAERLVAASQGNVGIVD